MFSCGETNEGQFSFGRLTYIALRVSSLLLFEERYFRKSIGSGCHAQDAFEFNYEWRLKVSLARAKGSTASNIVGLGGAKR